MKTVGGQTFPEEVLRDYILQQELELAGSGGTAGDMLTALTDQYQDLLMVTGYNSSDVAVTVSLRDVSAGTVRLQLTIPASSAKVWRFNTTFKQTSHGGAWTATRPNDGAGTVSLYSQAVRKPK